jgi:vitamin B12 transporter
MDLDKKIGDFSFGGSYFVSGKRFDDTGNQTRLGGYALTDLRVAYALGRDWRLQFSANNIFDKRYETAAFFNQPRRNYMLTVRWQPAQ